MKKPVALAAIVVLSACTPSPAPDRAPMPIVKGEFGAKPIVEIPKGKGARPAKPLSTVVSESAAGKDSSSGEVRPVRPGDAVVANVAITVWQDGREYLNTYDNRQPTTITLGRQQVAPTWDKALIGRRPGTRVALVAPATQGFGPDGRPPAQVDPTETLVVVFDILASYRPKAGAVPALPALTRTEGPAPTRPKATVLRNGGGARADAGSTVITQYTGYLWKNRRPFDSSYRRNVPNGFVLHPKAVPPGWYDALKGRRAGSRILLEVPPSEDFVATPGGLAAPRNAPVAWMIDILDVR